MHRDFRPENLMFSYSDTEEFALPIKIGDFGLCRKVHGEHTKTSTLTSKVGHESYRAPEVIGNNYGTQADLFSLGLVIWEVVQLIKYRDMPTTFYKLVHESKTNLVKDFALLGDVQMKNVIISLTKRRIQDRAKVIPDHLIQVYSEQGLIIVSNAIELKMALNVCKEGDTIQIQNFRRSVNDPEFQLNTNNVTICANESAKHVFVWKIDSNGCKVEYLTWRRIIVNGNKNCISHCKFKHLDLNGSNNKLTNCVIGDPHGIAGTTLSGNANVFENCTIYCPITVTGSDNKFISTNILNMESFLFVISGSRNIIQKFKISSNSSNERVDSPLRFVNRRILRQFETKDLLLMREFNVIITADSSLCAILDGDLENAYVSGSNHTLKNLTVNGTLELNGEGHHINNCKVGNLKDKSVDSRVELLNKEL